MYKKDEKEKMKAFNPGGWLVRVGFQLNISSDVEYSENTARMRVFWPHVNSFKDDPVVVNFLKGLWDKGVEFAEANQATHSVREFGAFIFLNPDGSYSCTEVEPGPIVNLDHVGAHGSISASTGDYSDLSNWNDPNRRIPLIVGTMHTHYPATWAAAGFHIPVGPSSTDMESGQKIPGLLYDYTNNIEAGDPADNPNNPLKIWVYGVTRRPLQD